MAKKQSIQPVNQLGPARSLEDGAPFFALGECILVRIPEPIQVEGYVDDEATVVGSSLPPTSNARSLQNFGFIRKIEFEHLSDSYCTLEVFPVVSFTASGGAGFTHYNGVTDAAKALLLPLPPLSPRHPTPDAFGAPLDVGNWSGDSFLYLTPKRFRIAMSRPFKRMDPPLYMPFSELQRIELYRETLRSAYNHDEQSHPPPNRSGDGQGSSNPRHEPTGDGGGVGGHAVISVNSFPTIIGDGGGEKAADDLLSLESVDEDAEDADATLLDELKLMASVDPIWREELKRYLQNQEMEREQMQKERAVRLAHWREDLVHV